MKEYYLYGSISTELRVIKNFCSPLIFSYTRNVLLLLFLSINGILSGQASQNDSCSGLVVEQSISHAVLNDSNIFVCLYDTLSIQDLSYDSIQNGPVDVKWTYNQSSSSQSTLYRDTVSSMAKRSIDFEVTNDSGCTIKRTFWIYPLEFESTASVNDDQQCFSGNEFDFSINSSVTHRSSHSLDSVYWASSSGKDTADQNWSYHFNTADTFKIHLFARLDTFGCVDRDTLEVIVFPSVETEITRFFGDTLQCYQKGINDSFAFSRSVSIIGDTAAIIQTDAWSYSGTKQGGDTLSFVFDTSFQNYGYLKVFQEIETKRGCISKDSVEIYIAEPPIIHLAVANTTVCTGSPFQISNNTIYDARDPLQFLLYSWDGEDTIYNRASSFDSYLQDTGAHELILQIETSLGCASSDTVGVRLNQRPQLDLAYSRAIACQGDTSALVFASVGSVPAGGKREWFVDGNNLGSDSILRYNPSSVGIDTLKLRYTNSSNCSDSIVVPVGLYPKPSGKIVRTSFDSCLGNVQSFRIINTLGSSSIENVKWSFPDGTQVYDSTVSKAFNSTGNISFTAEIEDEFGCLDTVSKSLVISMPPSARFGASSLSACENNQKFVFYDSSSTSVGTMTSRSWIFSDGTVDANSSATTKSHAFSGSGVFTLSLAVANSVGCVDTFTEKITVFAEPTADFSVNSSTQCLNINEYEFTNNSTSNSGQSNLNYYWSFGDSTSSNLKDVTKQYKNSGQYKVTLIATNPQGCSDSTSEGVRVLALPEADFGINRASQCVNDNIFRFSDSSKNNTGSGIINFREWKLGDNTSQTGANITKTYTNSGRYDVTYYAYLSNGCYDSIIKSVTVAPKPNSSFTVNTDTQCLTSNQFVFTNKSSIVPGGGSLSYEWYSDDSLMSSTVHPSISFNRYGNFSIRLKAKSQFGCIDEDSLPIQVVASPLVSFTSNRTFQQCNSSDTFDLESTTDSLNGRGLSYFWDFGDGTQSRSKSIFHSYANAGSYNVVLVASNSLGCQDSLKKSMMVYPDPVVDFELNDASQCFLSQDIRSTNKTKVGFNGGTLGYKWSLNGDSISNQQNVQIKSLNVGNYTLKLTVRTTKGCADSLTEIVKILTSPKSDFIIDDSLQCLYGNKFSFSNSSQGNNGGSYQWTFGDGSGSKQNSPSKVYQKYGEYDVRLIATTAEGCSDTSIQSLFVYSQPTIDFSVTDSTQCLRNNSFEFTPSVVNADGSSVDNDWDFGDKTKTSGNVVKHAYKNAGKYLVQLSSTTSNGCSDSILKAVKVYNQPQALFTVSDANQCLSGNDFRFANKSSIKDNSSLAYKWDFDDGSSPSTDANPKHSYFAVGGYSVKLIAESVYGCLDTFDYTMTVNPQPKVQFQTSDTGYCLNSGAVNFKNTSSISSGSLTNNWDFGDGRQSGGTNPTNSFQKEGRYAVKLISTSNLGCQDSVIKIITIYPIPQNDFTLNQMAQCAKVNDFEVLNNTTVSSGTITNRWDWSDGTISTTKNPSHSYGSPGDYTLEQVATTNFGCTDTLRKSLTVWNDPVAHFVVNDSIQCDGDNLYLLQNLSTIAFGKFETQWEFGDKTVKKSFNGKHSYSQPGVYEILQIVESGNGCLDSSSTQVKVTERPTASFVLNKINQCSKYNHFQGVNNSSYNGTESVFYSWDLGNAEERTTKDLNYSYKEFGAYNMKLSAYTSEGCRDSVVQLVNVYPQGISDMVVLQDTYCFFNNIVRFGNNSRVDGDRFISLKWEFGDGYDRAVLNTNPIEYSYNTVGTFKVKLVTTTNNLCSDTSSGEITVLPMPVAKASVNQSIYCHNEQGFDFKDISSNPTKTTTREWVMERRVVSKDSDYKHVFQKPGKHHPYLVIIDEFGCTDTTILDVLVNPSPEASFIINRSEQCLENNLFKLTNTSLGTDGKEGVWRPESGAAGFEKDFEYTYFNHGDFNVVLTVFTDSGCYDTFTRPVRVNPTPEGQISFNYACENIDVNFTANDTIAEGQITTYEWSLGDGKFTNEREPEYAYKTPGKFDVKLKMISDQGCILMLLDSMYVYKNPEPLIGIASGRSTVNNPLVSFYDSSYDGPYLSYEWLFGDGSDKEYDYEVSHKYMDSGNFEIKMIVTSFDLCVDTAVRIVRIWPDFNLLFPTAFSPNDDGVNDEYRILGKFQSIETVAIDIVNEYGNLVFHTSDIREGWNGRINNTGEPAKSGAYLIQIRLKDIYNQQFQTTKRINLVR